MFNPIMVKNVIAGLEGEGREYAAGKIKGLLDEYERLMGIFVQLDRMYQPHSEEKPFGLLDSPQSLIQNTRAAINQALNID